MNKTLVDFKKCILEYDKMENKPNMIHPLRIIAQKMYAMGHSYDTLKELDKEIKEMESKDLTMKKNNLKYLIALKKHFKVI